MGRVNAENIATYIVDIVTSLNKERRFDSLQKNVILFDNLNQIFTREEGGAIRIIFLIYEKLEALLYEDNHYWVQRAKSILYLKRKDIRELEKALIYAKKPYYDAYDMSRLQMQASLLVAMIYGRIAKLQFYQDQTTLFESISWYYAAFQESSFNQKIVGGVIEKAKREKTTNDLYSLHSHLLTNKTNLTKELERKANYLIGLIINY